MLSSWIRRMVFWIIDGVKGRNIRKEYCDIKKIMQLPLCEQRQIQEKYMKNIIEHAIKTTPFYYGNVKKSAVIKHPKSEIDGYQAA